MSITFQCDRCGHGFEVEDSLAGKHGHCKGCGHEMIVPSPAFRLEPLPESEAVGAEAVGRSAPAIELEAPVVARTEKVNLAPIEDSSDAGGIPEEFLADRAPYAMDESFEPPRSAVPSPSVPVLMEARAGWRHTVRSFLGTLAKFEDVIYLVLMVFWLIGLVAFLFEQKQLAWTMLGLLVICSLLLLLLGGFEVFVKPFQESLRHGVAFVLVPPYAIYYVATRWEAMKRPFRKAIGAFLPLIVLLVLALLGRPIRDWFLHAPHRKDEETVSVRPGDSVPPLRLPALHRRSA